MKIRILLFCILLLVLSAPVKAANWKFAGPTAYQGIQYYAFYDQSTYRESDHGRFAFVWVMFLTRQVVDSIWDTQRDSINNVFADKIASGEYPPDTSTVFSTVAELEIIANQFRPMARLMIHQELNCRDRKTRTTSTILYDENGQTEETQSSPKADWQDIAPETFAELLLRVVCGTNK